MSTSHATTTQVEDRREWEPPAIVLERSLEVSAQDPDPGERRKERLRIGGINGFIGPFSTSGRGTNCQ